ncbi:ammonium transporter [Ponticaulis sp.]|uniref:ammonium transporter n=1 Tax=Ponticaulis sp. TaxID=2020902 RepID=UPI000C69CAC3|nr:ammonium transporter [Ponticaulis sp.]MBN02827.1 ammonium transporter [Ponticaulis sp.]MDF1679510.1 ammonium transporter [Ponticaulis sp.]
MKETVWKWTARSAGAAILSGLALTGSAFAQEASEVSAYVDNSYLFLISGMVVMFMAAGFCMLEVGLVRSKNAATQSVKNIMIYSVAGIMVYLVGYHLIYPAGDWMIPGVLAGFNVWSEGDREAMDGAGYALASDWYFQMVFVATAASVVSGTVAERVKLLPFMIFTAVLTGFIYPIQASWQWGGGWLSELGFSDFAGSTLVHSTGGWAALVGAIILGPRAGKYVDGKVNPMPGSNIPLAALGTFILWLGWFGFNGGSQLAAGTAADINAVSIIFANTNLAAAGGVVAAAILTPIFFKKMDPTIVMNGAIGGLVAITAEPLAPALWESILIGAVGGAIIVFFVPLLDKLKIDDVVGAIPAHLVAGIFGTLVVAWNGGDIVAQATGVVAIGAFVIVTSAVTWLLLKFTIGIRCSEEEEMEGIDKVELGLEAYPEFSK